MMMKGILLLMVCVLLPFGIFQICVWIQKGIEEERKR